MAGLLAKLYRSPKCVNSCSRIRCLSGSNRYAPPPPENPVKRTLRILGNDIKTSLGLKKNSTFFPHHCDVVIIGGGIIGSSIAYWLQQRAHDGLSVVVVEKDPSYAQASTVLSYGGVRQQFTLPENIQMSMFGAEFLRNIKTYLAVPNYDAPDVQFTPCGHLFLATENGAEQLEESAKLQREMGVNTELLSQEKLRQKFPWLNLDDIVLGNHGLVNEGWLDPWSLLGALKRKAISMGTTYVKADAVAFEFKNMQDVLIEGMPSGTYESLDRLLVKTEDGEIKAIKFAVVVIAAGANSGNVARMARIGTGSQAFSVPLPVVPRKRYIYCFHCPDGPGLGAPFLIDPTGMFFRREGFGGNYISGISPDTEEMPSVDNLEVDYSCFQEKLWPLLRSRIPEFEHIKLKSAWAGYYGYNEFDENGIIGPHPMYHNLYIASGFSGLGLQQAAAVGRAVMEMIVDGGFQTIDLSRLGFDRLFSLKPLFEKNIT